MRELRAIASRQQKERDITAKLERGVALPDGAEPVAVKTIAAVGTGGKKHIGEVFWLESEHLYYSRVNGEILALEGAKMITYGTAESAATFLWQWLSEEYGCPEVAGIVSDPMAKRKVWERRGYPAPPTRAGCKDWDWGERQFCTKGAVITVWIAGELAAGKPHFAPTIHSHITVHHSGELLHDEYMGIEQGVGVLRSFRIGDAIQAGNPAAVGITTMAKWQVGT